MSQATKRRRKAKRPSPPTAPAADIPAPPGEPAAEADQADTGGPVIPDSAEDIPPGPKTITDPQARCRRCDGTELRVLKKIAEVDHHGVLDGKPYTSVIRRRVRCGSCGQVQVAVARPFDPTLWRGPLPAA